MSWFKDYISLAVGVVAIGLGVYGQNNLSNILEGIVEEIDNIHTESSFMDHRITIRENIAALDGYIKNNLIRDATLRDLVVNSDLKLTPRGTRLLDEIGVDDMILKVKARKGDASTKHVLIEILSTDDIQRELLKYSEDNRGKEPVFAPEDLTSIMGAAAVYNQNLKQTG